MRGALAAMVVAAAALASHDAVGRSQRILMTFHGESGGPHDAALEMVRRNWYGDALLSGCTCHLGPGVEVDASPVAARPAYYHVAPGDDLDAAIGWAMAKLDGRAARATALGPSSSLAAFAEVGVSVAALGQVSADPLAGDDPVATSQLATLSRLYAMTSLRYLELIST